MHTSETADPDALHADLQEWLCGYLAGELGLPPGSIDPATPMSAYGLDSIKAVGMLVDVEDRVGFEIDHNALWDFPTVTAFTDLVVGQMTARPARS